MNFNAIFNATQANLMDLTAQLCYSDMEDGEARADALVERCRRAIRRVLGNRTCGVVLHKQDVKRILAGLLKVCLKELVQE